MRSCECALLLRGFAWLGRCWSMQKHNEYCTCLQAQASFAKELALQRREKHTMDTEAKTEKHTMDRETKTEKHTMDTKVVSQETRRRQKCFDLDPPIRVLRSHVAFVDLHGDEPNGARRAYLMQSPQVRGFLTFPACTCARVPDPRVAAFPLDASAPGTSSSITISVPLSTSSELTRHGTLADSVRT